MNRLSARSGEPRFASYTSVLLPAAVLGGLLIVTLVIQLILSWQAHRRLAPAYTHVSQMVRLQNTNLELQQELIENLNDEGSFTQAERTRMRQEIKAIFDLPGHLSDDTPQALLDAHDALADMTTDPKQALILALSHVRKAVDRETDAHLRLIEEIDHATEVELEIGTVTLLFFPAGAILLLYLLRRRIFAPIRNLSLLMTVLGRHDYAPAPVASVDPLVRPLIDNYNAMVQRLAQLEADHSLREQDLENQVANAARTLLEQQRSLANAERMAAIGEMMARVAHELCNPLAGVKLACANLREELAEVPGSSEYQERIDSVSAEIDRLIDVLQSILEQSRHRPEPLCDVDVGRAVADLITLVRYQIPASIRIVQRVPEKMVCRLPDALLRQALLNLVLNAQQAIGDNGGEIRVDAEVRDGWLRLSVSDDGPGFPPDLLEFGIRPFVTHRARGTGLGLSMVQRFARTLGGRLMLANVEPHGACVTIELPSGAIDV
jgi:two-component system, NtrC family, sensor kinase